MVQKVRTGLRVPYEVNDFLNKIAKKKGISKNSLILQILWKWIEENENKNQRVKRARTNDAVRISE